MLFISALSDIEDKLKAFQVGGLDYISKPFQFEEVKARVPTHIQLKTYQDDMEANIALGMKNQKHQPQKPSKHSAKPLSTHA